MLKMASQRTCFWSTSATQGNSKPVLSFMSGDTEEVAQSDNFGIRQVVWHDRFDSTRLSLVIEDSLPVEHAGFRKGILRRSCSQVAAYCGERL